MSIYKNTLWHGLPTSVAILVPSKDTVYSHFAYSLSNLVKTTTQMGIETHLFFDASTILINQRENLIKQAIEVGAEWVLWLDSDMMFPPTTLLRLLGHNQNIVGCNYMKRTYPFKSVAYSPCSATITTPSTARSLPPSVTASPTVLKIGIFFAWQTF